ncbi:hypothetical protein [Nocardia xishanensis]
MSSAGRTALLRARIDERVRARSLDPDLSISQGELVTLSARIVRRIENDFSEDEIAVITQLLGEVVEAVGRGRPVVEERIAAAILLYSRGDADRFARAALDAQQDWRDLMIDVGLADAGWEQRIDAEFGNP